MVEPLEQQKQQLAARAAAKLQHDNDAAAAAAKAQTRRFSRRRLFFWFLEAAALLAAAEHFLIRPSLNKSSAPPVTQARALPLGPLVPALGEAALPLQALHEVVPAYAAVLAGLAEGSEAAQLSQLQNSRELKLPLEVENSIGLRMRLIPAGTFLMGSPENERGRDVSELQHVAAIDQPFYIGKFEVTQQQWQAVMGNNPSYFKGSDNPVEEVTWDDCIAFVRELAKRENLPAGTYRLPTEAQWEYSCRAGTVTAYYFGDDPSRLGDYADYNWNNNRRPNRVGQRLPNAYGIYDMHGNVWEWCLNRFYNYDGSEIAHSRNQWRSLRGGNWYEPALNCRSANRCRLPHDSHGNILGFRIVRLIPELQSQEQ